MTLHYSLEITQINSVTLEHISTTEYDFELSSLDFYQGNIDYVIDCMFPDDVRIIFTQKEISDHIRYLLNDEDKDKDNNNKYKLIIYSIIMMYVSDNIHCSVKKVYVW